MATSGKKPSAAQMAARRLFAERAQAGYFGGARQNNPKYRGAYPDRIKWVDVDHRTINIVTNDGKRYQTNSSATIGAIPKIGDDVKKWNAQQMSVGPMTIGPDFVVTQNPKRRESQMKKNPISQLFAVKLNAGNDRSGNPRRGWVVCEMLGGSEARSVGFVVEGFDGESALIRAYDDIPWIGTFGMSAKEYVDLKRLGPEWIKIHRYRGGS